VTGAISFEFSAPPKGNAVKPHDGRWGPSVGRA